MSLAVLGLSYETEVTGFKDVAGLGERLDAQSFPEIDTVSTLET
jgi:hypothetical protein